MSEHNCPNCDCGAILEARLDAAGTRQNAGEVGVMHKVIDGRSWFALESPEHDIAQPDPCPHDCATGIGGNVTPSGTKTIWECTQCYALGSEVDGVMEWVPNQ